MGYRRRQSDLGIRPLRAGAHVSRTPKSRLVWIFRRAGSNGAPASAPAAMRRCRRSLERHGRCGRRNGARALRPRRSDVALTLTCDLDARSPAAAFGAARRISSRPDPFRRRRSRRGLRRLSLCADLRRWFRARPGKAGAGHRRQSIEPPHRSGRSGECRPLRRCRRRRRSRSFARKGDGRARRRPRLGRLALRSHPYPGGRQPKAFRAETSGRGRADGNHRRPRRIQRGGKDDDAQARAARWTAAGLAATDIARFVPHQANARIIAAVRRNLGLEEARTIATLADYGNSSAATIPLSMSLTAETAPFRRGERILIAAVGAGLIGGALVFGI